MPGQDSKDPLKILSIKTAFLTTSYIKEAKVTINYGLQSQKMKSGDLVQHRPQVCTWRCAHASTIGGLISSQEQAAALPGLIRLIIILSDVLMISTAGMFVLLSNIVVVSDHNLQFT